MEMSVIFPMSGSGSVGPFPRELNFVVSSLSSIHTIEDMMIIAHFLGTHAVVGGLFVVPEHWMLEPTT